MPTFDYDLFVIGAGSGGVRAARYAASSAKVRVGIAEVTRLGGTCVNEGCVPKKLYVYASHYKEDIEESTGFGWNIHKENFSWKVLQENKDKEIKRLNGIYAKLLDSVGVDIYYSLASLLDEHSISLEDVQSGKKRTITAKRILIATGSKSYIPNWEGAEHAITSEAIFRQKTLPKHIVIVGGGYIAIEFATIFTNLGSHVDLVYRGKRLLKNFDISIAQFASLEVEKKGVSIHYSSEVKKIEKTKEKNLIVHLNNYKKIHTEQVLLATGRVANLSKSFLGKLSLDLNKNKSVKVDENFRTNIPSIFALGDVTGGIQLTPVAIAEAIHFIKTEFQNKTVPSLNYKNIPTAIFSQPSIGSVGLSEEEAKKHFSSICSYQSDFRALKHSLSQSSERSMVKIVVDEKTNIVLGVHYVGIEAAELIQGFAVALQAGATKEDFDNCIGVHPSSAEEFVTLK